MALLDDEREVRTVSSKGQDSLSVREKGVGGAIQKKFEEFHKDYSEILKGLEKSKADIIRTGTAEWRDQALKTYNANRKRSWSERIDHTRGTLYADEERHLRALKTQIYQNAMKASDVTKNYGSKWGHKIREYRKPLFYNEDDRSGTSPLTDFYQYQASVKKAYHDESTRGIGMTHKLVQQGLQQTKQEQIRKDMARKGAGARMEKVSRGKAQSLLSDAQQDAKASPFDTSARRTPQTAQRSLLSG